MSTGKLHGNQIDNFITIVLCCWGATKEYPNLYAPQNQNDNLTNKNISTEMSYSFSQFCKSNESRVGTHGHGVPKLTHCPISCGWLRSQQWR